MQNYAPLHYIAICCNIELYITAFPERGLYKNVTSRNCFEGSFRSLMRMGEASEIVNCYLTWIFIAVFDFFDKAPSVGQSHQQQQGGQNHEDEFASEDAEEWFAGFVESKSHAANAN